ncbi:MAG: efflux RND transporter periplasmic adaptor subunit [Betaproteobacteria bacterium]|nr:efflux RND transporter periplasmic adaptor subunit [Betaproteobacteria bacterium]
MRSAGRACIVACLAALVLLTACARSEDAAEVTPRAPDAGYVIMKSESVPLVIELAGRTSAYEVSEVRPQVTGIIRERLFTEGSVVRVGQTLYRIDASVYRATEAEAKADLASAEATRDAANVRANRLRPLAEIEAVSQQDYTDAVARAREAEAAIAQIRARLEAVTIDLGNTSVPAPISGRIGRSLVTTGALVTANQAQTLAMIHRLDPMFVDIQQSSADFLALRRALTKGDVVPSSAMVSLTLEDGSAYSESGTLQFAEAMVDPNTGSVVLRARFPNPTGLLLPGMYVRARLSQATVREAILVPQQGVSRDPRGQATVMLVGPDDKAVQRVIEAERTIGDKWLVRSGLRPGDRVITEGLGRIRAGQVVNPVPASAPAARNARAAHAPT